MVIKSIVSKRKNDLDEILDVDTLIERLKKLRALNEEPEKIGLRQYTWRSYSIEKKKR